MRSHGPLLTATGSMFAPVPWGASHAARFEEVFDHTLSVSVCADDLPEEANAVTLSPDMEVTLTTVPGAPDVRRSYESVPVPILDTV